MNAPRLGRPRRRTRHRRPRRHRRPARATRVDGADLRQALADRRPAAGARWRAGSAADVDAAVQGARAAFDDGRWAGKAPAARKKILQRFAEKILGRPRRTGAARDAGHGQADPVRAGGRRAGHRAHASPGTPRRWTRSTTRSRRPAANALALITREPMGVIGVIVPWNYPMIMAAWKLGPALAAGNSVVLKPSEKSPLTALRLAELAVEAGMPPGVLQRRAGLRPRGRRGAGAAHGRRRHRLHRLHAHRPAHAGVRRPQQPQARLQRARRQVGLRRLRRLRRPRARRQDRRRQHVLQPGRELQRAVARAGARERGRALRRDRRGRGAAVRAGRPAGRRHRDGRAGRRDAAASTVLGYIEAGRRPRAPAASPAAARRAPTPAATTSSRRCSTAWPTA